MSIREMKEMYESLKAKEKTTGLTNCEKETLDVVWTAIDAYEMQAIEDLF
jgi:hypothetical protein